MTMTVIKGDDGKLLSTRIDSVLSLNHKPPLYDQETDTFPSPFRDPAWQHAMVSEWLMEAGFPNLREHYPGLPVRENLPKIESYLDPLFWCLRRRGFDTFYLGSDSTDEWCRCGLDMKSYKAASTYLQYETSGKRHVLGASLGLAFDDSGQWAAIDDWENAHFLGGIPEFIADYFRACGGEDYARAWWYRTELCLISHYEEGASLPKSQAAFYRMIGWPPPESMKKRYKSGEDIDWSPMFGNRIKSCGPGKG